MLLWQKFKISNCSIVSKKFFRRREISVSKCWWIFILQNLIYNQNRLLSYFIDRRDIMAKKVVIDAGHGGIG